MIETSEDGTVVIHWSRVKPFLLVAELVQTPNMYFFYWRNQSNNEFICFFKPTEAGKIPFIEELPEPSAGFA